MWRTATPQYIDMHDTTISDPALRGFAACGCGCSKHQLNTFDYYSDVPGNNQVSNLVEVQFKNTRKGYFLNDNQLDLAKGDIVAVEASPGHDIGTVTLTGSLVPLQMKKAQLKPGIDLKRIYRKARPADIEKWEEARGRENATMIQSRQIAKELELDMKIGDVEYQGDCNKAIFYYIADQRIDFRKLIRVLADTFHIRIEMKQIGARQEAARIGGIGPCGRELCCASWRKDFQTVSTGAARQQDLATYFHFKTDILSGRITYSMDKRMAVNLVTISAQRAWEIIEQNKAGDKPEALDNEERAVPKKPVDLAEQDDLTRFDKLRKNKKRKPQSKDRDRAPRNREEQGRNNREEGRRPREAQGNQREEQGNGRDEARRPREYRQHEPRKSDNAPQSANQPAKE